MTSRFVRFSLPCLLLLALASPSSAGSRRSSLAGNLLIPDTDDIFIFPHLVTQHKRLVTFDLGTSRGLGSGGMVFGNENISFGAFAHRGDFFGASKTAFKSLGDVENINNNASTPTDRVGNNAWNWIDAIAGMDAGGMPVGLRVSVGNSKADLIPKGTPPSPDMFPKTNRSATALNAIVGTRLAALNADLSGEFSYARSKYERQNSKTLTTNTEDNPWQVSLSARGTPTDQSDALVLGWLGNFTYQKGSFDSTYTNKSSPSPPPPAATSLSDTQGHSFLNLIGGVGPVYHPTDRTNVAMYGTLEYERRKVEFKKETRTPADTTFRPDDEVTTTVITVPGWHIAADVDVASWLQVRAGLRSRFTFQKKETAPQQRATGTKLENGTDKVNSLDFVWTSGVGIHLSNLQIDAYLDPEVLTSGTALLGNSNSGKTFGLVTASYHF